MRDTLTLFYCGLFFELWDCEKYFACKLVSSSHSLTCLLPFTSHVSHFSLVHILLYASSLFTIIGTICLLLYLEHLHSSTITPVSHSRFERSLLTNIYIHTRVFFSVVKKTNKPTNSLLSHIHFHVRKSTIFSTNPRSTTNIQT